MENEIKYSEEIEKVINQKNTECAMYDTPECRFLNAENCSECAVGNLRPDRQAETKSALSRLMEAAPQAELEPLYTSHECLFCKGERNRADRFGLFDLTKPDPEGDWTVAIGKKKLGVKAADMILPVQAACCADCARRHKLIAYLPTVIALLIAAAGLVITTLSPVYKALFSVASFMPALTMLGFIVLAVAAALIVKAAMKKSFSKKTHLDVSEIPELSGFFERGFAEVADRKQGVSTVVFSKQMREHGVGSLVTHCVPDPNDVPEIMGIWPAEHYEQEPEHEGQTE